MADLLLLAIASFQICWWVVREEGPLGIFRRIRSIPLRALLCTHCLGAWVGAGLFALTHFIPDSVILIQLLAVIGLHTMLQLAAERLITY